MTTGHQPERPAGTPQIGEMPGGLPAAKPLGVQLPSAELPAAELPADPSQSGQPGGTEPATDPSRAAQAPTGLPSVQDDRATGSEELEAAEPPDKVGDMARLEIRGPFLLLFALAQQQSSLLHHAMADRPLQPAEFAVYSALRLSQPTTPTQLAATLGMKATTLSSMLVRMAKNGHLKRRRNPADGRSVVLSLSPAGIRATEESFTSFSVAIESFRRHLEIEEPALLHSLEAMSRALSRAMIELSSGETQASAQAGS